MSIPGDPKDAEETIKATADEEVQGDTTDHQEHPSTQEEEVHEVREDATQGVESSKEDESIPIDDEPNFTVDRAIYSELSENDELIDGESLHFLSRGPEYTYNVASDIDATKVAGSKEDVSNWSRGVHYAGVMHALPSNYTSPFGNVNSHWSNDVEHNGEHLNYGRAIFSNKGNLTGDAAHFKIREVAGLGTVLSIPLWHTGIWVTVKAPAEEALLELEQRILNEKINLGRSTAGAALSNASVYMNHHLISLFMECVHDSTYSSNNAADLKSVIKITDMPQMLLGLATSIYPNGYRYSQVCVSDPTVCTHIDTADISLSKLSWVDRRSISTAMLNHMSKRNTKVNNETLETYSNQHIAPQTKVVNIKDGLSFKFNVPTIAEYEEAGFKWVEEIINETDQAFGNDLVGDQRDEYLIKQSRVKLLRRYSHWIKEIITDDETNITDRDAIDDSLDNISGNINIRRAITEGVTEFIRNSIINAVGIPTYNCPKCNNEPPEYMHVPRLPEIYQLEVDEVFFTLTSIRNQKLTNSV